MLSRLNKERLRMAVFTANIVGKRQSGLENLKEKHRKEMTRDQRTDTQSKRT